MNQSSSYSDDEYELKSKLYDAMRHDHFDFSPLRRSMNVTEVKNKLNPFSSYSSEEVVLKSNIYKALEFNKYYRRSNFSDIVEKDSGENSKKVSRRSRFIPVNEMTSYSDDEEDILKKKLKL
ncbi:hypothetical protein ABMA28_012453 [Loxostege sticticalis]|uniref:Uncharacterized protein n=1 Tax=Loxostege sticticalis TaxID=481309 RepID=A0ABD0S3X2_LOXSC